MIEKFRAQTQTTIKPQEVIQTGTHTVRHTGMEREKTTKQSRTQR